MAYTRTHFARGMTIIEALVAAAVLAVIALILGAMFVTYVRTFGVYTKRAELVAESSRALQHFSTYAVGATDIVAARTIASVDYTTSDTTIIFSLPAIDASQDIIPGAFDYIVVTPDPSDNTHLLEIIDADASSVRNNITRLFLDDVAHHRFVYQNADPTTSNWVQFVLSTQATVSSQLLQHLSQTYVMLRNS